MLTGTLIELLSWVAVITAAITVHEFAHAKVADILGDATPRLAGRLTLNPLAHLDPLGFLMLIVVRFGWAKPVPINPYNFRDPKQGSLYVSLAGPLANFFMAWFGGIIIKFTPEIFWLNWGFLYAILSSFIWINLALGVFNLIPVPPLDGSHILEAWLPPSSYHITFNLRRYGIFILIGVLFIFRSVLISIISALYMLVT